VKSIKDTNILKNANINHIGDRQCEDCGSKVPIYERQGERISICMTCKNSELSAQETKNYEPPKLRELNHRIKLIEYIPEDVVDKTFDDYVPKTDTQKQAKRMALDFLEEKHQSIVFQGAPGIGKSHLFRCVARKVKEQRHSYKENDRIYDVKKSVLFAKVPELLKLIQSTFNNRSSTLTEDIILSVINDVDVLILDEIGGERSKSDPNGFETWSGDILYQIVDHRQSKRNLYNTNYSSKELKLKYGDTQANRILSRMMNKATTLQVDGPDHRMGGFE